MTNEQRIAQDWAEIHGWRSFDVTGAQALVRIAEKAIEREWHRTGCAELLAYYGLEAC